LKLELFIDGKLAVQKVENYRTFAPKPFVRVPLPQGSTKVVVKISKRYAKEITNVGDFVHYERDYSEDSESGWKPTGH
jgi:hypothetical protein